MAAILIGKPRELLILAAIRIDAQIKSIDSSLIEIRHHDWLNNAYEP
jgi:hypothetical protein